MSSTPSLVPNQVGEPEMIEKPSTEAPQHHGLSRPTLPASISSSTPSAKWKRSEGFWRSFTAICIPLLLSALEGSITSTALPTISEALDLGTKSSWVATAFLLASTICQPLYSQFGDMWGRKLPMMAAVLVFALGSGICAASKNGAVLITGRIAQGLGTGGIDLFAEMIICDIIPLRKRGPYLAIKHVAFAAGMTLGPLLGGVFAEHAWQWCFLINIPVCGVSLVVIWFWLRVGGGSVNAPTSTNNGDDDKDGPPKPSFIQEMKKVDYIGSAILTVSILLLLVALSTGGAPHPWTHASVLTPLIFGLLGTIVFAIWQRSPRCKYPIMPPYVFSNRTTNISFFLTALHGFITYGFQFYLPPFFQAVHGSSPTKSGIQVLPTTLVVLVLAAVGGPLLTLWGKYKPMHMAGFGLMTLGLSLSSVYLTAAASTELCLGIQLVTAAGLGIVVSAMLPAVQVRLPDSATAASAGAWAFLRGTGSLMGVAAPAAVFNLRFASLLSSIDAPAPRARLEHGQAYQRATASFVQQYGTTPVLKKQLETAFQEALRSVWICFAVLAAVGFVATWFEKEWRMRTVLDTQFGLVGTKKAKTAAATPETQDIPSSHAATLVQTPDRREGRGEFDEKEGAGEERDLEMGGLQAQVVPEEV
ncbi:MFS general substrate transporter [Stemphylium lycopersici]|nr:MFS general substrate transporter [Stemphylium lycopersici]